VFVDDVVDRNGRIYFRCRIEETLQQRALEIPDWMFAETCSATGTVETPVVSCSALRDLKGLLENRDGELNGFAETGVVHGVKIYKPCLWHSKEF
jgi:hypothetical protein